MQQRVPFTLRKRDVIISKVKARIRKTTHKCGIELPRDMEHARELDVKNGNRFCQDTVNKEMSNAGVAFEILEKDEKMPKGWSKVTGHGIWDMKINFTRKFRWALDGHKCVDPFGSTHAGVVSRDSVRIASFVVQSLALKMKGKLPSLGVHSMAARLPGVILGTTFVIA